MPKVQSDYTEILQARVEQSLADLVRAYADAHDRSLSSALRVLIRRGLEAENRGR